MVKKIGKELQVGRGFRTNLSSQTLYREDNKREREREI